MKQVNQQLNVLIAQLMFSILFLESVVRLQTSYLGRGGIPVPQAFGAPWIKKAGEFCGAASHQAAWFPRQAEEKQTREPQQHQAL